MKILSRTCFLEASRLFCFYTIAYSLLTALAVCTPLLHKGAPLTSVLAFIPYQLLYTSPTLVPLALCTAILSIIGRMREDGELIALRSVGISAWNVILGIIPLIIIISVLLSFIQHIMLPDISMTIREGKSDLVRRGVSTRINRGEHIWRQKNQGRMLMAKSTDGLNLYHIIAHNSAPDRDMFIYAPQGTWRYQHDLHLECENIRFLDVRHATETKRASPRSGVIPRASPVIESEGTSYRQKAKPDVKSFTELSEDIKQLKKKLRSVRKPGYSIHDRTHRHTQQSLRDHQLAWHARVSIPYALFAYFLIAAGLGLSMPIRNRMLAIFVGILLIVINILPGMIAVKGMGQYLRFNPGILIWLPHTFTAVAGGILIWRKR